MDYSLQTTRILHDEHMAEVRLLEQLEGLLLRQGTAAPPADDDGALRRLLNDLSTTLEFQSDQHFAFEEEHLFPRLAAQGEADIGRFLAEEHEVIREVGEALMKIVTEARKVGFTPESWTTLHRLGLELIERTVSHIQKEEMGLLPMVEQLLDGAEDSELALAYMAER